MSDTDYYFIGEAHYLIGEFDDEDQFFRILKVEGKWKGYVLVDLKTCEVLETKGLRHFDKAWFEATIKLLVKKKYEYFCAEKAEADRHEYEERCRQFENNNLAGTMAGY